MLTVLYPRGDESFKENSFVPVDVTPHGMTASAHRVKSDITAFTIIEALDRKGEMGVTEIAQETGIVKSSVHKHLSTLLELGYVSKRDTRYSLSLRWLGAGRRVRERHRVFQPAKREVRRLARRIGETVSLVVEEDGDAVYLFQANEPESPARPVEEGERIPAPISVGGKALLSYRPTEEIRTLVEAADLDAAADTLLSELRTLRDQRLVIGRATPRERAFSAGSFEGHRHVVGHGEPYRNLNSLAVPIRDTDNYALAAVEVSGEESSLYGRRLEEEVASLLVETGKAIETSLLRSRE